MMPMWSYECIFEHADMRNKRVKSQTPLTQTSETVVANNGEQALQYAIEELKKFEDYQLIAVVRRNPIIRILKEEGKKD